MPLFAKKFESKPATQRRQRLSVSCPQIQESLDDFKDITLKMGNKEIKFLNGNWVCAGKLTNFDDIEKLSTKIKTLEEENNLYQIKMDIMLDLLSENLCKLNALRNED